MIDLTYAEIEDGILQFCERKKGASYPIQAHIEMERARNCDACVSACYLSCQDPNSQALRMRLERLLHQLLHEIGFVARKAVFLAIF